MEGVMGVIVCFAGAYVPRDWASCDGQTLFISDHPFLFKLLGTRYGGNGITTFNLPDLRGYTAVSAGQTPSYKYGLGDKAGSASVTLGLNHLPEHTHIGEFNFHLRANSSPGIDPNVNFGFPADYSGAYATSADSFMQAPEYFVDIKNAGSAVPVDTRAPFLVVTHIICVRGIFPSRS